MTDDLRWTVIGSAMVVLGLALIWWIRRRTTPLP
jgi:MYXO-CTERM domain-containing protein